MTAPLFIPTRNRPNSLRSLLLYLGRFYPDARVALADGSSEHYKEAVREVVAAAKGVEIQFFDCPASVPLHQRCVETLESMNEELVFTCADDDYPLLDVLDDAAAICRERDDINIVTPASVVFRALDDGEVEAKLKLSRDYLESDLERRLKRYGRMHHYTYYGVMRRSYLIEKIKYFNGKSILGYGDFTNAFYDLCKGKIAALPEIGYLRTNNDSHSKMRGGGILSDTSQLEEVLRLIRSIMTQESTQGDDLHVEEVCDRLLAKYIGFRVHRPAILESVRKEIVHEAATHGQLESFNGIFSEGHDKRIKYTGQVQWAVDSLYDATLGGDNLKEPKIYNSIDDMK